MATLALLCSAICLLLLCPSSLAQVDVDQAKQEWRGPRSLSFEDRRCRIDRLSALEPTRRVPSEAGFTEYFDQFHEQLQCAGVAAQRRTIHPQGLLLPLFSNSPSLIYIIQGSSKIIKSTTCNN